MAVNSKVKKIIFFNKLQLIVNSISFVCFDISFHKVFVSMPIDVTIIYNTAFTLYSVYSYSNLGGKMTMNLIR